MKRNEHGLHAAIRESIFRDLMIFLTVTAFMLTLADVLFIILLSSS